MKIGKKGSIGFTIGGILAVISSLFPTSNHIISGQVKLIGGIALIIFGLSRLLFNYESKEEQKKNQRTALLIVSMLIIGVVAYFVPGCRTQREDVCKNIRNI
jgi:xanthine/uracil permease